MRYTIKLSESVRAEINALPGRVNFCGIELAPHEAAILADAINECAASAEKLAEGVRHAARAASAFAAAGC